MSLLFLVSARCADLGYFRVRPLSVFPRIKLLFQAKTCVHQARGFRVLGKLC